MNLIITLGMHVLAAVFLVGMAGSSVVIVISFIEDLRELFDSE